MLSPQLPRIPSSATSLTRALVVAFDKLEKELTNVSNPYTPAWRSHSNDYGALPTEREEFDRHRNIRQEMLNVLHSMFLTWHVPILSRDYRLYFPPDTQDELGGFLESVLYGAQRIAQFSSASAVPTVFGQVVEQGKTLYDAFMNMRSQMKILCTKFLNLKPLAQEINDNRLQLEYDSTRMAMITFDTKWVSFEKPFITSLVGSMEEPPKMIQVHEAAIHLMENALRRSTLKSPVGSRTPGSPRPERLVKKHYISELHPSLYVIIPRLALLYGFLDQTLTIERAKELPMFCNSMDVIEKISKMIVGLSPIGIEYIECLLAMIPVSPGGDRHGESTEEDEADSDDGVMDTDRGIDLATQIMIDKDAQAGFIQNDERERAKIIFKLICSVADEVHSGQYVQYLTKAIQSAMSFIDKNIAPPPTNYIKQPEERPAPSAPQPVPRRHTHGRRAVITQDTEDGTWSTIQSL